MLIPKLETVDPNPISLKSKFDPDQMPIGTKLQSHSKGKCFEKAEEKGPINEECSYRRDEWRKFIPLNNLLTTFIVAEKR
ncbi:CLUMA_CG002079, isoform A [Clunio marinus]|uniref:CLUMA_CG002079, isoform A n=1 Tax=Clunio marinus TaxID=568069 RepID=A0A1J1HLL3_9DIPT|nr:CLUMA_CG002079, isoform A [Clunio marinus]